MTLALPLGLASHDAALFAERLESLRGALPNLPDKPQETAEATLKALWQLACGHALSAEAAQECAALAALDPSAQARLDALIAARLAGTPLAHLTGRQRFMGLEMLAGPAALIPRRETQILGEAALELLQSRADDPAPR